MNINKCPNCYMYGARDEEAEVLVDEYLATRDPYRLLRFIDGTVTRQYIEQPAIKELLVMFLNNEIPPLSNRPTQKTEIMEQVLEFVIVRVFAGVSYKSACQLAAEKFHKSESSIRLTYVEPYLKEVMLTRDISKKEVFSRVEIHASEYLGFRMYSAARSGRDYSDPATPEEIKQIIKEDYNL